MTQESQSRWYFLHFDIRDVVLYGPLTASAAEDMLKAGLLSWVDLFRRAEAGSDSRWARVFESKLFTAALPPVPGPKEMAQIEKNIGGLTSQPPSQPLLTDLELAEIAEKDSPWFLQFQGGEYGPFTLPELQRVIESGRVQAPLYVWRRGLRTWLQIRSFEMLTKLLEGSRANSQSIKSGKIEGLEPAQNKRSLPRQAMVATVFVMDESARRLMVGVCADVSEGGFQLLSQDTLAFKVGEIYSFQIEPVVLSGVSPFSANAKLVWLSMDKRRAGLMFHNLDERSKGALSHYIEHAAKRR